MPDDVEAQVAIADLHGREWLGRALSVLEAAAEPPSLRARARPAEREA
jgi:hypothetical protein